MTGPPRMLRLRVPVLLFVVVIAVAVAAAGGAAVVLGAQQLRGPTLSRADPTRADLGPSASPTIVDPSPGDPIPAGHVPILMYHYIRVNPVPSDNVGRALSVNPADFEQQMQFAHDRGYRTISMEQLYNAIVGGKTLDRRTMVLTFDDGYADFYTTAWPVLKKHGFTATAYIIGTFIGRSNYMTWDQVVEVDRAGINIGSHTLTHPDLTKLSAAAASSEITGSKAMIESHVGHSVLDFCYPSGRVNPSVAGQVRAAGFRDGTTTIGGAFESVATAFIWPRVRIDGRDALPAFTSKLASGFTGYQQFGAKPPPGLTPSGYPSASPFVLPTPSPSPGSGL